MTDTDFKMTEAMKRFGGSFVQQLAVLLRLADSSNYAKLKAAFPEYCEKYRAMGSKLTID